jgi:Raf kinase inhibitor-like YbhB/YbcL family protein
MQMALKLKSTAFGDGGQIPKKYAGDGDDLSPPLSWDGAPEKTKSFALICDDPDAPVGTFVHWVIYDIPPDARGLEEGVSRDEVLPDGAEQGKTDFGRAGYGGPNPPPGKPHRYFFKLYALDRKLEAGPGLTKAELLDLLMGHIIEQAEITGIYGHEEDS